MIYDANHPLKLIHSKGLWFAHNRKTEISNQLIYSQTRRVIVICRAVQEGARLNYLKTVAWFTKQCITVSTTYWGRSTLAFQKFRKVSSHLSTHTLRQINASIMGSLLPHASSSMTVHRGSFSRRWPRPVAIALTMHTSEGDQWAGRTSAFWSWRTGAFVRRSCWSGILHGRNKIFQSVHSIKNRE